MPINYGLLYGPLFRLQAVPAVLTPRDGDPFSINVLDDTQGIEVDEAETILPVAHALAADLAANSVAIEDLDKGALVLDGKAWEITAARAVQTPSGRAQGMVMMMLEAAG